MLSDEAQPAIAPRRASSRNYWAISLHRLLRKKVGIACLTIILLMYGSGILAPLVTPYGYNDQDLSITKQGPSIGHPFGTDRLGRDILTRIIYGLRTTVIITVVTLVTGSLLIGISLGLLAGYFGRFTDTLIMRGGGGEFSLSGNFPCVDNNIHGQSSGDRLGAEDRRHRRL